MQQFPAWVAGLSGLGVHFGMSKADSWAVIFESVGRPRAATLEAEKESAEQRLVSLRRLAEEAAKKAQGELQDVQERLWEAEDKASFVMFFYIFLQILIFFLWRQKTRCESVWDSRGRV
jgi:hypothetical protein